ncbi:MULTISPECIES: hypothetical protein [unclassified Nocardioides]|uniref:hypothetical protein n=1 Tax=unclassified Nocardioides TaxID=2615069 RepID=UPI000AAA6F82|nr:MULTISPECIES: hypothetical protein [unclassified Nocardioides]
MTKRMKVLGPALLVTVLSMSACNDDSDAADATPADPAATTVHVHFTDSSVPPEDHRSWDLTLDQDTVHLVVDSYGDVLADETVEISAGRWKDFVADLDDAVDELGEPEDVEEGCTGGTAMSLEVQDAGSASTSMDLDNCASDTNRAISDEIEELVEPFTSMVGLAGHLDT